MPRAKKQVQEYQEPKTNGMAIAGFILTMLGIFTFGYTTIAGFVVGIIALFQINKRGEKGEWMAIVSIIFGTLLLLFLILGASM